MYRHRIAYEDIIPQQKRVLADLVQQQFADYVDNLEMHLPPVVDKWRFRDVYENTASLHDVIAAWASRVPGQPLVEKRAPAIRLPKEVKEELVFDVMEEVFAKPLEYDDVWASLVEQHPQGELVTDLPVDIVAEVFAKWAERLPGDVWHTALPQL